VADLRPSWHEYFLGIAKAVASRGDCRRAQHGAVLVRPDRTVASVGYNGSAPGGLSCLAGECPRGLLSHDELPSLSSYDSGPAPCHAMHAEQNACAFAREDTTGYTMYVTGEPCPGCIKTMKAHRIEMVCFSVPGGRFARVPMELL
jgi:dCMP deaminase